MLQSYLVREGCGFLGHVFVRPPELHETGTIRKHWNRATIYVETKRVHEQLSEICALECGLKNCGKRNVMCKHAYGNCANSKHI